MNDAARERVKELLTQAAALPVDRRALFVGEHASDPAVAREALALLATLEDSAFMSAPTVSAGIREQGAGNSGRAAALGESVGDRIGRYKLLQKIGEGGFGTVFMAEQAEPVVRRIALKIIKLGMDTRQVIARFEAERQALALMDHPNIARVLDAGATESGRPFFVMELVRGEPVTAYCDGERLSLRQRLDLFRDICNAVQHAHQKGIIHRDIKPSNVLVTIADGAPLPKIIDFGIAKATNTLASPLEGGITGGLRLTDKTLFTELQQLIGTPEYMSPEQAEVSGVDIDTRSDVYALGVLLFELLTGGTPFDGRRLRAAPLAEIQRIIREEEPPRPSTRVSRLSEVAPQARGISETRSAAAESALRAADATYPQSLAHPGAPGRSEPGSSVIEIARCRRTEPPLLRRALRGDLDWIVMKCLEKDRRRRYATASALADDVGRYLDHQPVLATPPSAGYKLGKFVRRNCGAVLAGVVVTSTLFIAAGLSLAFGLSEVRQRRAAESARAEAKTRADELEQVTAFQEAQLSGIDAQTMGVRLREDLLEKARAAAERSKLPPDEVNARVSDLEELIAGSDFTGMALEALDDNFFQPALAATEEQFADQPLVKARLLQTLATTLQRLGLLDAASEPQDQALAIRRRELGDEHPDTLASLNRMGFLLQAQGKQADAEPYFREALERYRRVLGDDHPDTLRSIIYLGGRLSQRGMWTEAERCFREAMEGYRRVLGNRHPDTLHSIDLMGFVLNAQAKPGEAEPYYREVLETRRRVLGNEHFDTLKSIGTMGYVLRSMGMLTEAKKYSSEALEGYRRMLSNGRHDALTLIGHIGGLLQARGDLAEAEPYYREALEIRRHVLGDSHPDTLNSMGNLSYLLRAQGKLAEAEPDSREALAIRRRVLGNEHPKTLNAIINFGVLLMDQGKLAEAEPYCREVWEKRHRVLRDELPDTLLALYNLGRLLQALDKPTEVVELLAPAEPAARRAFTGGIAVHLGRFLTTLGRARTATSEFEAAETNLREAYAILIEPKGGTEGDRTDVLRGLVEFYNAWHAAEPDKGYDGQAAEWQVKLDEQQASAQPALP